MIISKLLSGMDKDTRENIAAGLAGGLVCGLAGGLVCGLAGGLVCGLVCELAAGLAGGLVFGLAYGLVCGLAGGLVVGLAGGLVFGLAFGLATGVLSPLWLFVPAILVISEILFYFDGKKLQEGQDKYWFTLERKAEAIFETLLIVVNMMNVWVLSQKVDFYKILIENCHVVVTAVFWLGVVAVGITALAAWIWLNSLKYREHKKEQKTRSEIIPKPMEITWKEKKTKQNPFAKSDKWKEKHRKGMLKYWKKRKAKQGGR